MNKDFMGIVLEVGLNSKDTKIRKLYEDVRDGNFVDMAIYSIEDVNESISEPLNYQGLKMVKEKYGTGISLTNGNTEMRFVSDKFNSEELEHRIQGIMESQDSDVLKVWLKNNTFCYLTQKMDEEESEEKEETEDVADDVGESPAEEEKPAEAEEVDEATQTTDVADKVDQDSISDEDDEEDEVSNKYPQKGKAYEFPDGLFVVEDIIDGVVYLIGPDDEYYSIEIEDFQNEVIGLLDEDKLK